MENSRLNILNSISDWLKLMALIVLIAESAILLAMKLTPNTQPIYAWYPIFMLLFLMAVVVGVFFDRYLQSKRGNDDLTIEVGDIEYSVKTHNVIPAVQSNVDESMDRLFVDSERGFQFELPKSEGWSKPERLDFGQYIVRTGLLQPDQMEIARTGMALLPMGTMVAESSALCIWYGNPIEIVFTDETTTKAAETFIERLTSLAEKEGEALNDEDIKEIRKGINSSQLPVESLKFQNGITILAMSKKLAQNSPVRPTLANLFLLMTKQSPPLDQLVANEDTILWGSTMTIRNVRINQELREMTVNSLYHLTEGEDFFYQVTINYSPQTDESWSLWNELQSMSASFNRVGYSSSTEQSKLIN